MISKKALNIFGTDGVRGRANIPPMTVENALALGRAAGKLFRRHDGRHRVVIGKDTRLSCYMFENALIAGFCSMGVDTLMMGPLPTPGVAFITRAYRADAGVVISASHNPYYDNGIKFFSSEGFKLSDEWEKQVEALVRNNDFENSCPADWEIGKNTLINDVGGRYIEFVKATFPRRMSLKNLTIALDCANGAGYRVAPLVFRELDAEVFDYGVNPDGFNINDGCGSLHPQLIQKSVLDHSADVGIALDGDADRIIMVDERGQLVDGDVILAICAEDMKKQGFLGNNKVIGTVMTNLGIIHHLESLGIEFIPAKVGDRHVIREMQRHGANLGGEQSGHVIFLDYNTTGDALVTALQVLRIMIETGTKLSDLVSKLIRYPQALVNVKVASKPLLETLPQVQETIAQCEKSLGSAGKVLVRYSGTESVCRVMVEGRDQHQVQNMAESIADAVKTSIGRKSI
ncbi:MAG: phosphoglucosamine mutase [Waddliaceae bacterium]